MRSAVIERPARRSPRRRLIFRTRPASWKITVPRSRGISTPRANPVVAAPSLSGVPSYFGRKRSPECKPDAMAPIARCQPWQIDHPRASEPPRRRSLGGVPSCSAGSHVAWLLEAFSPRASRQWRRRLLGASRGGPGGAPSCSTESHVAWLLETFSQVQAGRGGVDHQAVSHRVRPDRTWRGSWRLSPEGKPAVKAPSSAVTDRSSSAKPAVVASIARWCSIVFDRIARGVTPGDFLPDCKPAAAASIARWCPIVLAGNAHPSASGSWRRRLVGASRGGPGGAPSCSAGSHVVRLLENFSRGQAGRGGVDWSVPAVANRLHDTDGGGSIARWCPIVFGWIVRGAAPGDFLPKAKPVVAASIARWCPIVFGRQRSPECKRAVAASITKPCSIVFGRIARGAAPGEFLPRASRPWRRRLVGASRGESLARYRRWRLDRSVVSHRVRLDRTWRGSWRLSPEGQAGGGGVDRSVVSHRVGRQRSPECKRAVAASIGRCQPWRTRWCPIVFGWIVRGAAPGDFLPKAKPVVAASIARWCPIVLAGNAHPSASGSWRRRLVGASRGGPGGAPSCSAGSHVVRLLENFSRGQAGRGGVDWSVPAVANRLHDTDGGGSIARWCPIVFGWIVRGAAPGDFLPKAKPVVAASIARWCPIVFGRQRSPECKRAVAASITKPCSIVFGRIARGAAPGEFLPRASRPWRRRLVGASRGESLARYRRWRLDRSVVSHRVRLDRTWRGSWRLSPEGQAGGGGVDRSVVSHRVRPATLTRVQAGRGGVDHQAVLHRVRPDRTWCGSWRISPEGKPAVEASIGRCQPWRIACTIPTVAARSLGGVPSCSAGSYVARLLETFSRRPSRWWRRRSLGGVPSCWPATLTRVQAGRGGVDWSVPAVADPVVPHRVRPDRTWCGSWEISPEGKPAVEASIGRCQPWRIACTIPTVAASIARWCPIVFGWTARGAAPGGFLPRASRQWRRRLVGASRGGPGGAPSCSAGSHVVRLLENFSRGQAGRGGVDHQAVPHRVRPDRTWRGSWRLSPEGKPAVAASIGRCQPWRTRWCPIVFGRIARGAAPGEFLPRASRPWRRRSPSRAPSCSAGSHVARLLEAFSRGQAGSGGVDWSVPAVADPVVSHRVRLDRTWRGSWRLSPEGQAGGGGVDRSVVSHRVGRQRSPECKRAVAASIGRCQPWRTRWCPIVFGRIARGAAPGEFLPRASRPWRRRSPSRAPSCSAGSHVARLLENFSRGQAGRGGVDHQAVPHRVRPDRTWRGSWRLSPRLQTGRRGVDRSGVPHRVPAGLHMVRLLEAFSRG